MPFLLLAQIHKRYVYRATFFGAGSSKRRWAHGEVNTFALNINKVFEVCYDLNLR